MNNKITEARRVAFEEWYAKDCLRNTGFGITAKTVSNCRGKHGDYRDSDSLHCRWVGWNAALDSLNIELPKYDRMESEQSAGAYFAIKECRAAIEQTGLGVKIL